MVVILTGLLVWGLAVIWDILHGLSQCNTILLVAETASASSCSAIIKCKLHGAYLCSCTACESYLSKCSQVPNAVYWFFCPEDFCVYCSHCKWPCFPWYTNICLQLEMHIPKAGPKFLFLFVPTSTPSGFPQSHADVMACFSYVLTYLWMGGVQPMWGLTCLLHTAQGQGHTSAHFCSLNEK